MFEIVLNQKIFFTELEVDCLKFILCNIFSLDLHVCNVRFIGFFHFFEHIADF